MKYDNQSFQHEIETIVSGYPQFKVVEKSDEHLAHQILENQGMQLLDNVQLTYSRRPDLWKSFSDSNQRALVFYEKEKLSTIAAFSETQTYYEGKPTLSYYSSDLRITPKASLQTRKDFRDVYQQFIAALPEGSICTTAILKDNLKAMNAFTRGSVNLFYNLMFEYFIRTVIILPTIFLNRRPKLPGVSVHALKDHPEKVSELKQFLMEFQSQAAFSNDLITSRENKKVADEFILMKDDAVVGFFSLYRPVSRMIYVKTTSKWVKFLLKLLSLFSRSDLSKKLPWVYVTALVLSKELEQTPSMASYVILSLLKSKVLKMGELLLFLHPKEAPSFQEKIHSSFFLKCPQIINTGVLFRVESKKTDRSVKGAFHLDPSEI